jgi:hypothetical protein
MGIDGHRTMEPAGTTQECRSNAQSIGETAQNFVVRLSPVVLVPG